MRGEARAKGKDSSRSTKQLILSPGGIFYGRYNLQDASLKATRVYQRKPAPPPFRPVPSYVSRRISFFRLHLTVDLFLFNSSQALRRCNFFRSNFSRRFYSPLPHRFRIYLSKISRVPFVTLVRLERERERCPSWWDICISLSSMLGKFTREKELNFSFEKVS